MIVWLADTFRLALNHVFSGRLGIPDSAIRATHVASGISVRVKSERSQHANKKMAKILLMQKLMNAEKVREKQQNKDRWQAHQDIERGNPIRVFEGHDFRLKQSKSRQIK